jgi:hypothetical protein
MDGGFWLRVTHFCEGELENNPRLAIVVECTLFCLGGGGNDETQNRRADMESSIQMNGFAILWHLPLEKMTACTVAGICFRKIGGI